MKRNIFKLICILLIIFNCSFMNLKYVNAEDEFKMHHYIPENIHYTINGGIINLNSCINDEGSYEIDAHIDTNNLEDGYYTAFIYENLNKNWNGYEGISFNFENLGKEYVDLSIDIITKDQNDFKVSDKIVYLKSNSNNLIQQMKPINGVLKISEKFYGTIIIPFENLKSKDTDIMLNPSEISLWGVNVTLPDNKVNQFMISDFSLVNFNKDFKTYMNNNFIIHGDSEVIIPSAGEFTYLYRVLKNPTQSELNSNNLYINENYYKNVSFKINEDIDGVSITKDGVLYVENYASPRDLTIIASIDENEFTQGFKVELVNSKESGMVAEDGISIDIPKINELSNIIKFKNIFMNNKYTNSFRILIITGFLCFFIFIAFMKSRIRNNE